MICYMAKHKAAWIIHFDWLIMFVVLCSQMHVDTLSRCMLTTAELTDVLPRLLLLTCNGQIVSVSMLSGLIY